MFLRTAGFWKCCKTCRNLSMREFTVTEVTVFRLATFLYEALSAKYNFLGIYEIFSITNSANLDCQMLFQWGIISSDYWNFDIDNYSFLSSYEIAIGKNVKQQLNFLFASFPFPASMLGSKVQLAPPTVNICRKA